MVKVKKDQVSEKGEFHDFGKLSSKDWDEIRNTPRTLLETLQEECESEILLEILKYDSAA